MVTTGGANSSDRFGARMSREVTARKRSPSIGVFQAPPIFQAVTLPEVLYLVWRTAPLMLASPNTSDFRTGTLASR